ncbi:hypothetical protein FH972_018806 [Carpinus fangiana]|uniref:Uncharacterized protein n=1 Tax=Carpinus fangiana TaxID=176857 RepID=A0A5N6RPM8_9ROSI|nr:hypothetical protein FH972_018806 [Carpinus fangiana]
MEDRSLMEGFTLALNYTLTLQTLSNRKQRFAYHIRASLSDRSTGSGGSSVVVVVIDGFAAVKQRNFSGGLQDRVHLPRLAFAFVFASFLSREPTPFNSNTSVPRIIVLDVGELAMEIDHILPDLPSNSSKPASAISLTQITESAIETRPHNSVLDMDICTNPVLDTEMLDLIVSVISLSDNDLLCGIPDEPEIHQATTMLGPNKAPGLEGRNDLFYKNY